MEKFVHAFNIITVESPYFEVIRIKKGLRIIRIHRARELKKNVDDRSEISYKCAGGWRWT